MKQVRKIRRKKTARRKIKRGQRGGFINKLLETLKTKEKVAESARHFAKTLMTAVNK